MRIIMAVLALQVLGALGLFIANLGSAATPPSDLTCSNGIRGIEDQGSCCVAECGTCGGPDCAPAGVESSPFRASECCSVTIQDAGDLCDVTGVAPCIVHKLPPGNASTPTERPATVDDGARGGSTCSNGFPGIEEQGACCTLECGQCGGHDCATAGGLTSAECCMSTIIESGVSCSESGAAPCVMDDNYLTPSASIGKTSRASGINKRGAPSFMFPTPSLAVARGLDSVTPSPADLGGAGDGVNVASVASSVTTSSAPTATQTCNNGIPGIQSDQACCVLECGQCGGLGCTTAGRLGQSYCCSDIILNSDISCSVSGAAPCIVEESSSIDPGGFTSGGDPITSSAAEPLISATTCDILKSVIEAGESGTYELANDVICDETITIVEGQYVTLTSTSDAPSSKYSIAPTSPFTGGTSPTTSTASGGGSGGDYSILVVENGGSLNVMNVIFDSSSPAVNGTTTSSASTTAAVTTNGTQSISSTEIIVNASPTSSASEGSVVRVIFTAGNVTVEDCEFAGPGDGATPLVMNGGAIYMADADDASNGPSTVTCVDSTFDDYSVGGSGGAIFAEGSGSLDVSDSTFVGNSAGLYSDTDGSDTTDANGTDDNGASGSGGAIYAGPGVFLSVTDSTFEGNSATDGGAIACYGGTLSGVTVSDTTTSEAGFGAVMSSDPGDGSNAGVLSISDCSFGDNSGGVVAAFNTDVNVTRSAFTDNDGALYFETSDPERGYDLQMNGVDFEGNGPPPESWGVVDGGVSSSTATGSSSTGSGYLVIKETGDGSATSTVDLTSVTCAEDSVCAMTVDDTAFEVTGDTDCGVCDEGGDTITVRPATDEETGDKGILDNYFGLIIGLVVLALLLCCPCLCCYVVMKRRKESRRGSQIPVIVDRA